MNLLNTSKVFGGLYQQFSHMSSSLHCKMRASIFLPEAAIDNKPVPVLYWLSGLTCTDENFVQKAGAFRKAAELGIAIVAPDTSPRGEHVADDEGYDLGQGAGFYVNATQPPWHEHYNMYDYITRELPKVIECNFPVNKKRSIAGHSMGGHGALVIGLRNAENYCSISAFSPIANPMNCAWGQKAFTAYLGKDKNQWRQYDACELLQETKARLPILVDQGDADDFLESQLKPKNLAHAANSQRSPLELRMQPGYDHSYYFIASFIDDHIEFHHKCLKD